VHSGSNSPAPAKASALLTRIPSTYSSRRSMKSSRTSSHKTLPPFPLPEVVLGLTSPSLASSSADRSPSPGPPILISLNRLASPSQTTRRGAMASSRSASFSSFRRRDLFFSKVRYRLKKSADTASQLEIPLLARPGPPGARPFIRDCRSYCCRASSKFRSRRRSSTSCRLKKSSSPPLPPALARKAAPDLGKIG